MIDYTIEKVLCDFDNTGSSTGRLLTVLKFDGVDEPVLDFSDWVEEEGEIRYTDGISFDIWTATKLTITLTEYLLQWFEDHGYMDDDHRRFWEEYKTQKKEGD